MKIVDEIEDNYSGKSQDDAISEACPIEAKFSSSEVPVGAKVLITPEKSPFSPNSQSLAVKFRQNNIHQMSSQASSAGMKTEATSKVQFSYDKASESGQRVSVNDCLVGSIDEEGSSDEIIEAEMTPIQSQEGDDDEMAQFVFSSRKQKPLSPIASPRHNDNDQ